jgi:uncharacterized protein (DUF2141 family)
MKTFKVLSLAWILAISAVATNYAQSRGSGTGTLLVLVSGFENTDGHLLIALYKNSGEFMGKYPTKGAGMAVDGKDELAKFEKLPYGTYALVVLHDINNDSVLNKNFLGIPTEGYGFSNNAMGSFGPPSFQEASFVFAESCETKIIDLQYGIPK